MNGDDEIGILPCGAVASEEEFAHLEACIKTPKKLSPTILYGAALLQKLGDQLGSENPNSENPNENMVGREGIEPPTRPL